MRSRSLSVPETDEPMKKIAYCLVFLTFCMVAVTCAFAGQDSPDGFRDILWGTDIKDLTDMTPVANSQEGERFYTRKNEPLQMENAAIESVRYGFYKDKFFMGFVEFKSRANFVLIKEQLERRFGTAPGSSADRLVWDWPKVKIILYYDQRKESGSVDYYYKPLLKQKFIDQKIKEKKGRPSHY